MSSGPPALSAESLPFFHNVDRAASAALLAAAPEGAYLLRPSSRPGFYSLDVKLSGAQACFLVQLFPSGQAVLHSGVDAGAAGPQAVEFAGVAALLGAYPHFVVPVHAAGARASRARVVCAMPALITLPTCGCGGGDDDP